MSPGKLLDMGKEKRTRPCTNCKNSKVRCVYSEALPCERCIKKGQSHSCQYVSKLPSLKFAPMDSSAFPLDTSKGNEIVLPLFGMSAGRTSPSDGIVDTRELPSSQMVSVGRSSSNVKNGQESNDRQWKDMIEDRINNFDTKLSYLVDVLRSKQDSTTENASPNSKEASSSLGNAKNSNFWTILDEESDSVQSKKRRNNGIENASKKFKSDLEQPPEDFRDGFLSIEEAKELFSFFDTHISPQLFGFEISKFKVDTLWETSPILICAICVIGSIHHPDPVINNKLTNLRSYLQQLCNGILYKGKPENIKDGYNIIFALILCSLWLEDSQMFTGIALQLSKEIGLNPTERRGSKSDFLSRRDRLKLWYLLYILDGQQSLAFNRQPIFNSEDKVLRNSRALLLTEEKKSNDEKGCIQDDVTGVDVQNKENGVMSTARHFNDYSKLRFPDMRLVSQVEYNQAIGEALRGDAWDLLTPSALGLPSKSNLELDKWMVSWTVLLAPVTNGAVWSSKSVLLYYHFAKMHINSNAVRLLHGYNDSNGETPAILDFHEGSEKRKDSAVDSEFDSDEEKEDGSASEEFLSNRNLAAQDQRVIETNIALSSAHTVLNLVLDDQDIQDNLKYVPLHIHIMLYYAALLLINPPELSSETAETDPHDKIIKALTNLKVVKTLQKKIYLNLPTDKDFGSKLIKSLDDVLNKKMLQIKNEVLVTSTIEGKVKNDIIDEISLLSQASSLGNIIDFVDTPKRFSSPEKISAWPGYNHGHI